MSVKPIVIKISAWDNASRVFGNLSKQSDAMAKRMERVSGFSRKIGVGMLGGAGAAGFAMGLSRIPGQLIQVEETAARLAFTEKFTAEESARVGMAVKDMSREVLQSQVDLLKAVDTIGDAGFALDETLSILPMAAKQATAFGKPLDITAGIAKALGANFKIAAKEMPAAMDIISELSRANIDLEELASVLPRIGQASRALNLNGAAGLAKFAATLEVMREGMRDSSATGKGFSKLLEGILDPAIAEKFKNGPGIDLRAELEAAGRRGEDQWSAYLALVKRVTDSENKVIREGRIKDLFGDQDSAAIRAVLDDLGKYQDGISKYMNSIGVTDEGFIKALRTTAGQLQKLRETVLSTDFKPMARGITILNRALEWLNDGKGENAEKAIYGILTAASVGGGLVAIGQLSSGLRGIGTAFSIIAKGGPLAIKTIEKLLGMKAAESLLSGPGSPGVPVPTTVPSKTGNILAKGLKIGGGALASFGAPLAAAGAFAMAAFRAGEIYESNSAEKNLQDYGAGYSGLAGGFNPFANLEAQAAAARVRPFPASNPDALRAAAGIRPAEVSGTVTIMLPNAPPGTRVATRSDGPLDFNPQLGMGR